METATRPCEHAHGTDSKEVSASVMNVLKPRGRRTSTSTRACVAVAGVALTLAGAFTPAFAGSSADTLAAMLAKLDEMVASLRGVTQNWDKALPANDPGGPCPSSSSRFACVFGGAAVRDNQTGLVWEQAPTTLTFTWDSARFQCINHTTGGQKGWRLPSVNELASLIDPTHSGPALPPGHPFSNVAAGYNGYWTGSTDVMGPNVAWALEFNTGYVGLGDKSYSSHVWCVRGPANSAHY